MYKLSRGFPLHKRDLRSLDCFNGLLVTGGSDQTLQLFNYADGNLVLITKSDIIEHDILCVRINKVDPHAEFAVLAGCADGKIYAFDNTGNPLRVFEHNSRICSIDFIDAGHFVSGSWDGKALVWQISSGSKISQFSEHKHAVAVFYNSLNNTVISGSQDKALNMWNWRDGSKVKRVENAHKDIVREIVSVQHLGFITCSNDESLIIWNSDLEPIQTILGHNGFIFSVKSHGIGQYFSGGEEKILKVWENDILKQDIHLPAEIWSICIDASGSLLIGTSDGYLRIFSTDPAKQADPATQELFKMQTLSSASKKSGMSAQDISKLQSTHQMNAIKGKKQGQVRVFKNGQVPEAYMWQSDHWEKIGEVLTDHGQGISAQPRQYPGDKYFKAGMYDFIFDVDDESGIPKQIPFNAGGNALEAAQMYCKREGMGKGVVQQIRKFLIQNSKNAPARKQQMEVEQSSEFSLLATPATSRVEFLDIKNPQGLLNKLKEFNEKIPTSQLSEKELMYSEKIIMSLEKSQTYHSWKLDFKQMDTLHKLLQWPKEYKLPVWDTLRAFLKHYQSQQLFSSLNGGIDILSSLSAGLETDNPQVLYTLILKTLANIFIQNTNTNSFLKNSEMLLRSLRLISKRANLKSANYLYAFSCLLYNLSIAVVEKGVVDLGALTEMGQLINERLKSTDDKENRRLLLQAGANILCKTQKIEGLKPKYEFLQVFLQEDDASRDLKILLK